MNSLDIAVVIPVYNREKTIERCIDSILGQTVLPRAINLVDDGSTDQSIPLMEKYAAASPLVHIFHQQHQGAQAARNRGIREADTEWIAFLDSDDEWCPDYLETVSRRIAAENDRSVVICTSCYKDDGAGRAVWHLDCASGNAYPVLLSHPGPMLQGLTVKKKELEAIGGLDESCPAYQEWETSLRLSKNCEYIFIDEPHFIYYVNHGVKTISGGKNNNYRGWKYVVEKHKAEILRVCGNKTLSVHYRAMAGRSGGATRLRCYALAALYLAKGIVTGR